MAFANRRGSAYRPTRKELSTASGIRRRGFDVAYPGWPVNGEIREDVWTLYEFGTRRGGGFGSQLRIEGATVLLRGTIAECWDRSADIVESRTGRRQARTRKRARIKFGPVRMAYGGVSTAAVFLDDKPAGSVHKFSGVPGWCGGDKISDFFGDDAACFGKHSNLKNLRRELEEIVKSREAGQ